MSKSEYRRDYAHDHSSGKNRKLSTHPRKSRRADRNAARLD
jgi:hypothetical protein